MVQAIPFVTAVAASTALLPPGQTFSNNTKSVVSDVEDMLDECQNDAQDKMYWYRTNRACMLQNSSGRIPSQSLHLTANVDACPLCHVETTKQKKIVQDHNPYM